MGAPGALSLDKDQVSCSVMSSVSAGYFQGFFFPQVKLGFGFNLEVRDLTLRST